MAIAATTIKANFGRTYKGVDEAYFYELLNEIDILITRHFGLRKKTLSLSVDEASSLIDLDSRALWIESARWVDRPHPTPLRLGGFLLDETNIDEQDTSGWDWRANEPGTPSAFMQTHDLTGGQVQLDRPSLYPTLIATAATNATPIVVTTNAAHGLSDGDRVDIRNGLVNTNVNGDHYAKVTGYSTTTFALYSDSDLATAVAGNGVYTANSALVNCQNSPYLQLFTRWHEVLTSSSSLPDTPLYPNLYTNGCCFLYAQRHAENDIPKFRALFEDVISEQIKLTQNRGGRKPMQIRLVNQRPSGFVNARGSSGENAWSRHNEGR